jgi:hypothetical protein
VAQLAEIERSLNSHRNWKWDTKEVRCTKEKLTTLHKNVRKPTGKTEELYSSK